MPNCSTSSDTACRKSWQKRKSRWRSDWPLDGRPSVCWPADWSGGDVKKQGAHRTGRLSMRLATPSHIYGMADAIKTDILSCSIPCLSKPNLQWPDLQCNLIPLFASQAEKGHNSGSLFIQPPGCS